MKPTSTTHRGQQERQLGAALRRAGSNSQRLAVAVFVVLFTFVGAGPVSAQDTSLNEYLVKAAFLFHFAEFVEWPGGAFDRADSPLVYCTIGEDPFHGALDASLKNKTVRARATQVRHLKQIQDARGCHLVFIGEDNNRRISAWLAVLQGSPILTVGESERFVQEGGMIAFCIEENKIRFEINLESAGRANLKISSRLLTLAKTVIGKPRGD